MQETKRHPDSVDSGADSKETREATAQSALKEDELAAQELERKINLRLYKIDVANNEILRQQIRIQRYRQEIHRLSAKRSEFLTLRLL